MGAFTLTNGALLGGLAMLAAPLIAHLLQRRARKPIVFPSIAFLQQTVAQQSHFHRLRRLILLLLRMAALACVVLAFTRPVWWTTGLSAGERQVATATVLVIDSSVSTSQQTGSASLFDRLKAEAIRNLDQLKQGTDLAAVVYAGIQPEPVFPRLTANLPDLTTNIAGASVTDGRAGFSGAIGLAVQLLNQHSGPRRLIVLTDRQSTNWKPRAAADESDLKIPPGVDLLIPEFPTSTEPNLGLSNASMQPEHPRPEAEVETTVFVRSFASQRRDPTVVAEWVEGDVSRAVGSRNVSLASRQSSIVTLSSTMPSMTLPAVRWQLTAADSLAADNTLWLASSSALSMPVVIASDDSPDEAGTAAFYLSRALAPFGDESGQRSPWSPRYLAASRLSADDLKDVRILVLGYCGVLKPKVAAAVAGFVEAGGSLLLFAGNGPANLNMQQLNDAAQGRLVPWLLLSRIEAPRRSPLVVETGRWNSRWLRDFDEPSQLALREIAFRRAWQAGAPASDAEILLSFQDEQPAMGLRRYGRGQCLLVNFSPESTASDLGKSGTFVALLQMLASRLADSDEKPSTLLVGDRLTFHVPPELSGKWTMTDPTGRSTSLPMPARGGLVVGPRSSHAGLYRLQCDGKPVAVMAVNLDPEESDLTALPVEELKKLLSRANASENEQRPIESDTATPLEAGRPLWGGFLLAGLGVMGIELFLLGLWRR